MNKSVNHSYNGMIQDVTKSEFSNQFYFDAKNIRILATDTQSSGSITNEKGNSLILSVPTPIINYTNKTISYNSDVINYTTSEINYGIQSNTQLIIGYSNSRDYIVLFTTDNNGFDCIWKVNYSNYKISLLYLRNLNFSINYPIQTINNFENINIDKVYWVDGNNQMRFININHSVLNGDLEEVIDIPENVINMVGEFNLTQPIITKKLSGGSHTSGMIQYAYNLYRLNSSQTKLSSLSELISLDKGVDLGGGALNEKVGTIPVVRIDNIDTSYTNIKVYAIKYTSYNEIPSISLIEDREIPSSYVVEVFDDGSIIENLSLEEFLFLGSDIMIPKHINSKDNRLFFANYKELNYELKLDCRAYSFKSDRTSIVYDNVKVFQTGDVTPNINGLTGNERNITNQFTNNYDDKFDSINLDYDLYRFQENGITYGGEGKYLKYELTQSNIYDVNNKYFKDEEIYRTAIQFYNSYGQVSLPNWIADFKVREGNLLGNYNTFKVELKPDFYVWLNTSSNFTDSYTKPIGYKILIAERGINDKTIVANGILGTMMINNKSTIESYDLTYKRNKSSEIPKIPNILLRNCNQFSQYGDTQPLKRCSHLDDLAGTFGANTEVQVPYYGDSDAAGKFWQFNNMLQLYSPEVLFSNTIQLNPGLSLKIKGALKNNYNASWSKEELTDGNEVIESKAYFGISPHFAGATAGITGSAYSNMDNGIIAHPGGSNPNRIETNLFYRGYGNVKITDNVTLNNIVQINNSFVTTSGSDPLGVNVGFSYGNRAVRIKLDDDFDQTNIEYVFTPNVGYTTVPYTIKICSDNQGNNVLAQLTSVTGTQTINFSQTFTYNPPFNLSRIFDYFLVIEPTSLILGNLDVEAKALSSTVTDIIKESNTNSISVNILNSIPSGGFISSTNKIFNSIYGTPEITEKGQDFTTYNNDTKYRYTNSLQSCLTDGNSNWREEGTYGRRIVAINSDNNKCITLVTGPNTNTVDNWNRKQLENLFSDAGLTGENNGLIGELFKSKEEIYLGGIYGGNSWEDKKRTNYIEIGDYSLITNNVINIDSPGDTFVNYFKFLRIVRKETTIMDQGTKQYEEIVEFLTETTVDVKNRNDLSLNDWDNKFQYFDADYHKYNKVYSQQPDLIKRRNLNYNFKKVNNFDTNIISSKLKSAGEIIDNWTDLLVNDVITLDGKFGTINSLCMLNDELYSIQDKAFSFLSINPRVQIQGSDGLAVELGTGGVLQDYKYITTDTGTINKWSVVSSPQGIYFYDALNKSFNAFRGNIKGLSDEKGLHTYFVNNNVLNQLKTDNPLIKQGISSGYDFINNDVFMSFHQGNKSFTISFNEIKNSFISFYDYIPSIYISRGDHFITTHPDINKIYKQYAGEYNKFYDVYYPSSVTLNVNPEPTQDCVFDNINFKSDVTLNNVDQVDKTITGIRAYNDYQDSNSPTTVTQIIIGRNNNARRKFRDWNVLVPRQGRNRIRAPYIKLKVQFDNTSNYKLILHNMNVFYTTN